MDRGTNTLWAGLRFGLFITFAAALHVNALAADETSAVEVIRRFKDVSGLSKAETNRAYHLSGTFITAEGKITGSLDVDQQDRDHQWLKVEIPQHGKHLRARNGTNIWHFDPPPNSRAGDGWYVYPRPGYTYGANESQRRFHELFDLSESLDSSKFDSKALITSFNGDTCLQVTHLRGDERKTQDIFDPTSGLRIAIVYGESEPTTFLLSDYKKFSGLKLPTRITEVVRNKTNDVLTVSALTFTNFLPSRFAMPLRVRDWPAGWSEFDEAYPPPSFVKEKWPWKGEHSRYFHDGFSETNSPYFWSYVVFNALEGDTLKTADELKDALHLYDAALYGEAFPPEKIKVSVGAETTEDRLGHTVSRRVVKIDGFDAEASRKPLTTYLQVFRWYCPVADRTGIMILRSPRKFDANDEVWKTLLGFWNEAECHPAAR